MEDRRSTAQLSQRLLDPSASVLLTPEPVPAEIHWQFARTELANERTFLAWVRTALSLFGIGYGILKVEKANQPNDIAWYDLGVGFGFLSCAVLLLFVGIQRYNAVQVGLKETIGIIKQFERIDMTYIFAALGGIFIAAVSRSIICVIT